MKQQQRIIGRGRKEQCYCCRVCYKRERSRNRKNVGKWLKRDCAQIATTRNMYIVQAMQKWNTPASFSRSRSVHKKCTMCVCVRVILYMQSWTVGSTEFPIDNQLQIVFVKLHHFKWCRQNWKKWKKQMHCTCKQTQKQENGGTEFVFVGRLCECRREGEFEYWLGVGYCIFWFSINMIRATICYHSPKFSFLISHAYYNFCFDLESTFSYTIIYVLQMGN